ncbi:Nucleoporin nup57 [Elasticomyces elasticus]|nr:Nucleoporin nup57 [Elasticomyces elasticus]KAK3649301.1 Nucleoporin nup57 [Elasticomyces elasticus]KAK4928165.1 Nucleoporin nup57 [Elasticomyces elasticus]KAK5765917.1 Nucleoporin nup57 [Elasticomyces elasticus]
MGLFDNLGASQPAQGNTMFNTQGQQGQQQQPPSLFSNLGSNQQQPQQQQQQSSLFSNLNTSTNQQQPQQQQSLFSSLGNTQQPQQQPQQQSLFGASQHQPHHNQLANSLQHPQRSIPDEAATLVRKWDPNSQSSILQSYLYNAVQSSFYPFYQRPVTVEETAWEEALSKAPASVVGEEGEVKFVPVLVCGFLDLGKRVEVQALTVRSMLTRLHEMRNSLQAVMEAHQQRLTSQLENSRRRHKELEQRTLRLAVKLQGLRNRGYALSPAEEELRKNLLSLSAKVQDPQFAAREEEVWARLVSLRDRARWLEEEGKRLGANVEGQGQAAGQGSGAGGSAGGVPEEVLAQTRKILRDYEGQLRHLSREVSEVSSEFRGWEVANGGAGSGGVRV